MKITFIKQAGGLLIPASDIEAHRMEKFKTGCQYEVEIKRSRNPAFHGKVFAFLNFCFEHWRSDLEFIDDAGQFEVFRNHLTCLAGYYHTYVGITGDVRIQAQSLSYGNMEQEEFERCYNAMINAAMKHVFKTTDNETFNRLMSFF